MTQGQPNYKAANSAKMSERWGAPLAWLVVAALFGWAVALVLGVFGDRQAAKLPAWTPPPLAMELKPQQSAPSAAPSAGGSAPWQLVGIADDRVYVRSDGKPASFAEGDTLPNGDVIKKIERDALIVSSKGRDARIALYKTLNDARSAQGGPAAASNATTAGAASCRLSGQDRAIATFIESAVAAALMKEAAAFNRIFSPIVAVSESGGGVRAAGTGGTTAAFGIQDGDALFKAEGRAITSGQSVLNEVMARIQRGEAVVVEGERNGAPRRWVFAPTSCRT